MKVARSTGLALELLGDSVTPFFRVLRLRRKFLNGIEVVYGDASHLRTASEQTQEGPLRTSSTKPVTTRDAALEFPPQHSSGEEPSA